MLPDQPARKGNRFFPLQHFRFNNPSHAPFIRFNRILNATTTPTLRAASATRRKSDLQRSLRLCTIDGLVAMPIVTISLPVNVFMTALVTKAFVLPKPDIGLLSAMPFLGNFIQIFIAPFLGRLHASKAISVVAATLHLLLWLVLGVMLPFIPRDNPAVAARWLILWFLASSCAAAIAGVAWSSWIQEWVPPRLRGKFFSRRNRLLQFSTLSFLFGAGWALAHWDYAIPAFQLVVVVSVVLRVFSIRWQWQSPTRILPHATGPVLSLRKQVGVLRGSGSFLTFIAFGSAWSFAANCFGPFYHVFMFEELGFSAFDVGILSVLAAFGGALSLPAWGLLLDRFGNKSVMTVSLLLWQTMNFLWCFLEPANRGLSYGMWVWGGMTSAGFVLGQFTILLRLIPPEAKSLAIGLNLAITSLVAAFAPVVGGAVLGWALGRWPDALAVYHVCFIFQPVAAIAGCILLLRVAEPQASPIEMVFGAMRNIRTLSGVFGLDFLVNYVFYRPQKR
ncbi:MAG: MFS transporter [Verrucomicrobia bacterium]|nr:MFS transporter [Verrucomicrobiota bacterium]